MTSYLGSFIIFVCFLVPYLTFYAYPNHLVIIEA